MIEISTVFASMATSLGASGLLIWLTKSWISQRLKSSIEHEYATHLEKLT